MKKIFHIICFVILIIPRSVFPQTPQQIQQLNQINADIKNAQIDIAKNQAKLVVTDFFNNRFGYIHQTNAQCVGIVDQIESLANQLKTPKLISQKITSSDEAYSALEVLSNLMIREKIILDEIEKQQEEFEMQKRNLKETEKFLYFDYLRVKKRFPKPDFIEEADIYYNALWVEYQSIVANNGRDFKYFISKCADSQFDIHTAIQNRKNAYTGFYNSLKSYYIRAYEDEYRRNIISKYEPSENTQVLLAINSAFNQLDKNYRDAILLQDDYFKAISTIEMYPNLASIILAKAIPREKNAQIRAEAEAEVQRRVAAAENYKNIIKKEKPSYWLKKKYTHVKANVESGKISCLENCKKHLDQAESLIHAAEIIEDISNETIYSVLGYQVLDLVK